jgi:hypothetical protein
MTTTRGAALAFTLACLAAGPASAATCHMTVQGVPVIDDRDCAVSGRAGDVTITVGAEDAIRVRRAAMSGRFVARRPGDGRLRRVFVRYGQVVVSRDSDDKTCYFNQRATLCVDP